MIITPEEKQLHQTIIDNTILKTEQIAQPKIQEQEYSIIYNEKRLRQKCTKVDTLEEGQEISKILFKILAQHKNGIGLSAIQIGILKNVFVINVTEPLYFVNAEIISQEFPIIADEGCLSFPNKYIKTKRFAKITLKADNINGIITYGYSGNIEDDFKKNPNLKLDTMMLLESLAIQHEYSHQEGKLMYDYLFKQPDYRVNKIGRNKEVNIINNFNEQRVLKYKKAIPLLNSGLWRFKE
jgi:peptide deformylase